MVATWDAEDQDGVKELEGLLEPGCDVPSSMIPGGELGMTRWMNLADKIIEKHSKVVQVTKGIRYP